MCLVKVQGSNGLEKVYGVCRWCQIKIKLNNSRTSNFNRHIKLCIDSKPFFDFRTLMRENYLQIDSQNEINSNDSQNDFE